MNLAAACIGDSVSFSLTPWSLRVNPGDIIEWHMSVTAGQVGAFDIGRPNQGRWPYGSTGRIPGNPQRPAIAPPIPPNAKEDYRYQVTFECRDARTNSRHNVVIDPDIWVN